MQVSFKAGRRGSRSIGGADPVNMGKRATMERKAAEANGRQPRKTVISQPQPSTDSVPVISLVSLDAPSEGSIEPAEIHDSNLADIKKAENEEREHQIEEINGGKTVSLEEVKLEEEKERQRRLEANIETQERKVAPSLRAEIVSQTFAPKEAKNLWQQRINETRRMPPRAPTRRISATKQTKRLSNRMFVSGVLANNQSLLQNSSSPFKRPPGDEENLTKAKEAIHKAEQQKYSVHQAMKRFSSAKAMASEASRLNKEEHTQEEQAKYETKLQEALVNLKEARDIAQKEQSVPSSSFPTLEKSNLQGNQKSGSREERNINYTLQQNFDDIDVRDPMTYVWMVEGHSIFLLDSSEHGKLCSGHAYIILDVSGSIPHHIFCWFGKECRSEAKAIAMAKLEDLDDALGGLTVQHRETQGSESGHFLSVFKGTGISYYGSEDVPQNLDAFQTTLLHLKGRRTVRVTPVAVSYSSLNNGDSFILDTGKIIYSWNGSGASRAEKATAIQTTLRLKNSRGGSAVIIVLDEGHESPEFWKALGGKGPIKKAEEVEGDDEFERQGEKNTKLYLVSDATGSLQVTHIGAPPFQQLSLNHDDCHILDIETQIFVWIGRGCTLLEKKSSMENALKFLKDSGRPDTVPITRLLDGYETPIFKSQFVYWSNENPSEDVQQRDSQKSKVDKLLIKEKDTRHIDAGYYLDADKFSSGEGTLLIYRVENFKLKLLPASEYGVFYSGDSYIIKFSPLKGEKAFPIVYYWLGRYSTQDEQGAAAHHTRIIAEGQISHCRVVQGKEPSHFVNLFKGRMVIRNGGVASGFNTSDQVDSFANGEPELFHVRGTTERDTRTVEVPTQSCQLNSGDCFLVNYQNQKRQYIWNGKGSAFVEREYAQKAASFLREISDISDWDVIVVEEGEEPEEFWDLLGGKQDYMNALELQGDVREPRLFHCSNASGQFEVEEIFNFAQEDLMMDDIFLLDTYSTVFCWIGPEANEEERKASFELAVEYVNTAQKYDNRDPDTPIICTLAGYEPPMFTSWFHGWDPEKAGKDSYEILLQNLTSQERSKPYLQLNVKDLLAEQKELESGIIKTLYSYDQLARKLHTTPLPGRAIDVTKLEMYLFDDEFLKLFKMTKEEWITRDIPGWKRRQIKEKLWLF
eukprot:TRINITY_DN1754_c0_g1_i4.p1 TRINITY_DN1754_c0_g1~~TRINITY_DN1754_c0_g1_i4.p1  ORF type:complete len:1145 (-),score=304.34 TRINITY_DN1754_c0_g1_i4:301-3735(-)